MYVRVSWATNVGRYPTRVIMKESFKIPWFREKLMPIDLKPTTE